ncbi:MAG TPA: endopeptidase La [Gemmatimonadaceae bacterium]|nr:endopeptidase La [Gemmatimonadaceae bacterium]
MTAPPDEIALPPELPLLALRSTIVFPLGSIAVQMGAPENLALLRQREETGLLVALAVAVGDDAQDPARLEGKVGVLARVKDRSAPGRDTIQVTLEGLARVRLGPLAQRAPFPVVAVEAVREVAPDGEVARALIRRIADAAEALVELNEQSAAEVPGLLRRAAKHPSRFADLAAAHGHLRIAEKDEVLQRLDVTERLEFLAARWEKEVVRARVLEEVRQTTEVKVEQHHREFYLRQQLQAIRSELGERDPTESDAEELLRQIEAARLPEKVAQEARRETERLRALSPASGEYQVLRNYVEWVLALPWNARSGDEEIALEKVERALDARHYGLEEAKERILEYLSVRKLLKHSAHESHGPILCFVGPPGTGKTSLGEAIAQSIGRAFYRISVGGVRDEAEIRGHRRTYVGSLPGLILQALRRVQVSDPVLMIDEIDKMQGGGPSGDPLAAMLEVLDPTQNAAFVDHFLNLPFDLRPVLFICTANNLYDIPAALRDRMEMIRIAGYTVEEKVEIAWRYLLPRLFAEHGITDHDLQFTDEALSTISRGYSREAGLRGFERNLAALMRKRARRKAAGEDGAWIVDPARIEEVLGAPRYPVDEAEVEPEIGTVTGLAWTASGGELMTIEALRMPGTGKLTVTGQLGEVMRESVDAACSYVRSRARVLRIVDPEMRATDLHIHFPAGSVPKDGPSAGVAVTLAIASVMSRRPVRRDVAVTGEVTLRGRVLEIGGIKEKVLAAYRSGLTEVMLPAANEKDLREVPAAVRERVRIRLVETMDEVLAALLLPAPEAGLADELPADSRQPSVLSDQPTADG